MEPEVPEIINQILRDSREKAKSIIKETRKSAEMMLEKQKESARRKAEEKVSSMLKKTESEVATIRGTVFTDVRRKASWTVLYEKERLVTNVLDEVKTKLEALSQSKKYISILETFIVDAGTVLGGGTLEVLLNKRDSTLPLKLNVLAKAITDKTEKKTQLKLSKQKIETFGGVVVKTGDGKIVADNTFEAILKRREKELRFKIAKFLFRD
jgi:vacuolar-type H+-ATPase subunit E/Vma4